MRWDDATKDYNKNKRQAQVYGLKQTALPSNS